MVFETTIEKLFKFKYFQRSKTVNLITVKTENNIFKYL